MSEKLNQTHIVLIPKIQGPETLGNYRPISLCNTTYKIVTKILVARLRPYLGNLISPLQSAFVLGRKGIDNAIIVQELIHTISKKNGKVGYMAIKIDLEKAQLIEEKCHNKLWSPVKVSRSGPAFSHLMFADDLVLFVKVDSSNCSIIRDVLDEFCAVSGQTISDSKSKVYFSPNVDQDSRESLSDILGFVSTSNLGKYLGIPIKHPNSSSQEFNFILDRVKGKLVGWKANLLSLAGRAVLVQSSTSTIPSYAMQCSYLPDRILQGVDRVNRNFLWGSTDTVKKMHWVGWHKVTKPKSEGGLGLQTAKGRNVSLLAKLNWQLHTEGESSWAQVLRAKYCNAQRLQSRNVRNLPCSRVWSAVKKGADTFNKGIKWVVGRNSNLRFWFDH
ncbi:uncharacterized protein LOC126703748 [Quercus robur]|uniref:uncharacterized protein LOC126703748 n=1 Tax=Quercus robur TaxID=38942 RepID=UPI0021632D24|nr:uncharacterized protein LOC126703748 [Quercus robur]